MLNILAIALAIASGQDSGQVPATGPIPEAGHSTIGYANVAEALSALLNKKGVKITEHDGWTVIQEGQPGDAQFALWSFSPASYPAYPAVAKRTVYERNGSVWIDLSVQCEASKAACDQMVRAFQAMNERAKETISPER
jgi:hypothetical protein